MLVTICMQILPCILQVSSAPTQTLEKSIADLQHEVHLLKHATEQLQKELYNSTQQLQQSVEQLRNEFNNPTNNCEMNSTI